jgi:hypothetical protein
VIPVLIFAGDAKRSGLWIGEKGKGENFFRAVSVLEIRSFRLMDFFKLKKFGKARKGAKGDGDTLESDEDASAGNVALDGDISEEAAAGAGLAANGEETNGDEEYGEEEEEDEDYYTNEVKRRLKEAKKNSFMVQIPEDENAEVEEDGDEGEEEEEEGSSSREWVESDVGEGFPLCGFDSLYDKYCQRMVVFDKMITQTLKDSGEFFWHIVV